MLAAVGLWLVGGCVSVQAPREVSIGGHSGKVDSSRVPETASHEEARAELRKAYAYVRELEDKKAEYKRERDRYKDRLKKYEDD
jgi:hypothetical protein